MSAIQLPSIFEAIHKEGFGHSSSVTPMCKAVLLIASMVLAGWLAWKINDGCPIFQKAVYAIIAFLHGWVYLLFIIIANVVGPGVGIGCSGVRSLSDIMQS